MILTYPSYYKKFKCIASECPDNCCTAWAVVVDHDSKRRYEEKTDALAEKIKSCLISDEDGDRCFKNENNTCPFFNKEGLCDIHITYGEEYTPRTCKKYPRFSACFGGKEEWGISLSCPEAARLILGEEKDLSFISETDDRLPEPNDIEVEEYMAAVKLRKEIFKSGDGLKLSKKACGYKEAKVDFNSLSILTEEWKAVLNAPETGEGLNENQKKKLFHYFIYRYLLAGVLEEGYILNLRLAIFLYENAVKFSKRGDPLRIVQLFSKEIEHAEVNLERIKKELK